MNWYNVSMIILITGEEDFLIRKKLDEIIQEDASRLVQRVDLEKKTGNLRHFFESCNSQSLLSEKRVIIVRNPYFLYGKLDEDDLKILEKYALSPSPDTDLIFYSQGNKTFDRRTKAYKTLKKNAKEFICEFLDEKKFSLEVRRIVKEKGIILSQKGIQLLSDRSQCSLGMLNQNLQKLMLFDDNIDDVVLEQLIAEVVQEDNFSMCDAFLRREPKRFYSLLHEYKKSNTSFLPLIAILANQLRYLYGVFYLSKKGSSFAEIADLIGGKSKSIYRVQRAYELFHIISKKDILQLLSSLSDVEQMIKTDVSMDETLRFEMLTLKWMNKDESNKRYL